jgi:hypothetical protein
MSEKRRTYVEHRSTSKESFQERYDKYLNQIESQSPDLRKTEPILMAKKKKDVTPTLIQSHSPLPLKTKKTQQNGSVSFINTS